MPRRVLPALLAGLAASAALPVAARAQAVVPRWSGMEDVADGEVENYLRSLQALGLVGPMPWSIRGFGPSEFARLAPSSDRHPWNARIGAARGRPTRGLSGVHAGAAAVYNTTFAHGSNDGAIWAGRGLTVAATAGVGFRAGPLSATFRPIAFWTENRSFALTDNGLDGPARFADGIYPTTVDRPQRFGDRGYGRVDPGQSTVRLDAFGVAVGASTANVWWGPAQTFPFLLGTNAAGFPHVFAGTSRPANIWVAHVQARLLYGRLDQSDHFVLTKAISRPRRFATGLAIAATPRGLDFVEVGAARFFHAPWPDAGIQRRYLTRPLEGLLKRSLPEFDDPIDDDSRSIDGENQLAAVFARVVVPGTGFEAYGEFGREDHAWDLRHLILSPDENASRLLGFRHTTLRAGGARMIVVRGETIEFGRSQVDRVKGGRAIYLHSSGSDQGHTQRGQLLGADVAVGSGDAQTLGVDFLSERGRSTVTWRRVVRQERLGFAPDGSGLPAAVDVVHTLGVERLEFRDGLDFTAGIDVSFNLNRNFSGDRTNVALRFSSALSR